MIYTIKQYSIYITMCIICLFACRMGNSGTKINFRKAVVELTTKTQVSYHFPDFHLSDVSVSVCQ